MNQVFQLKRTITKILLAFMLILTGFAGFAQQVSVNFDQSSNNQLSPPGSVKWVNGNLGKNSIYYEGMAVPQRIILGNLTPNTDYVLDIRLQATKDAKMAHAFDFMTSWTYAQEVARKFRPNQPLLVDLFENKCANLQGDYAAICAAATKLTKVRIPYLTSNPALDNASSTVQARAEGFENAHGSGVQAELDLLVPDAANIASASLNFEGYAQSSNGPATDADAIYRLRFKTTSTSAVIRFAGHLASGNDFFDYLAGGKSIGWGLGKGSGDISGSPYHISLDGLGSRDNQVSNIKLKNCNINVTNVVKTDISCFGANNGSLDLTVSGTAEAPFQYSWTGPSSFTSASLNISGLKAGTYTLTINDATGFCDKQQSYIISEPPQLVASISSQTNVLCKGGNNGAATINVIGGRAPYTYKWGGGLSGTFTSTATGLSAGTYTFTVTDASSCSTTSSVTITEPTLLTGTATPTTMVSCYEKTDGVITVSGSGGIAPYSYKIESGSYSSTNNGGIFSGLAAGSYTVTITDANSCTKTITATITQPTLLTAAAVATDIKCKGDNNGSIDLTVSGGTGTKTYLWSNSITTEDISELSPSTYSVIVTDANGCTATASATITEPAAMLAVVSITHTNVTCNGKADGSIDLTVSGGTGTKTYLWSNIATTEDISGLAPSTYSVTVTDANGCTATASATIIEPDLLEATISGSSNVSCYGLNDGSIDLNITGGTASYTVSWSGPSTYSSTTQNISALYFGTYSVEVTDANSCTSTASITITQPKEITLSATTKKVSCFESNDGKINVTNTNSTIQIFNSEGLQDGPGFAAGTYTVTANGDEDGGEGCSKEISVIVEGPSSALSISSATPTAVKCKGENSGKITISASGGYTTSYTYSIQKGGNTYTNTTGIFTDLLAGTYTASVTDDGGCVVSQSVTVDEGDVCYPFYTYSQGFYGNYGGKGCVSGAQKSTKELMQDAMDNSVSPLGNKSGEIKLGVSNLLEGSITDGTWGTINPTPPYKNITNKNVIDNIIGLMPAGGPSVSFGRGFNFNTPGTSSTSQYAGYVNNTGRIANTLFGQTMAIWFSMNLPGNGDFKNLDLSQANGKICLITKEPVSSIGCTPSPGLGGTRVTTKLPQSVITALMNREDATVEGLVKLAGEALTFGTKGATKYFYTGTHLSGPSVALSDLTSALGALVDAFHGGKYFVEFKNCEDAKPASNSGFNSQVESASAAVNSNTNEVKVTAFPNPYADRITFNITAKETGKSSLVLYNLLGQRVVSVFEGQMKANTTQTVIYNVPTLQRKNLVFVFTNGSSISTGKLMSGK